ncbi:hypothetical protein [Amycolatopsis aidingensis]|uniref:hypothetical protein n=1 Tax=Amycolatopsis aidingensis TaxID=2842453 RepID=UPI001C0AB7D7|nr:hypothetical protein [Amycolatopsis aidingensis]
MWERSGLPEDDLDRAAEEVVRRFEVDESDARELVDVVAEALEEGGPAVEDAIWHVGEEEPTVSGVGFVEDVADHLGYDLGDR